VFLLAGEALPHRRIRTQRHLSTPAQAWHACRLVLCSPHNLLEEHPLLVCTHHTNVRVTPQTLSPVGDAWATATVVYALEVDRPPLRQIGEGVGARPRGWRKNALWNPYPLSVMVPQSVRKLTPSRPFGSPAVLD